MTETKNIRRIGATLVVAVGLVVGCGNPTTSGTLPTDDTGKADLGVVDTDLGEKIDVGSDMDVSLDAPPADAAGDAGSDAASGDDATITDAVTGDAAAPDDRPAPADVPPVSCRRDTDCAAASGRPSCDLVSGVCVQCLPTSDACPTGSFCDATRRCAPGCRNGSDCVGSSAGAICDMARHACVSCLADGDCALGMLCSTGACVAGCNATHGCATGQTCCSGACVATSTSVTACGSCTRVCTSAHGTPTCTAGACGSRCEAGWGDCDTNRDNGCETSTVNNPSHCGGCGVVCSLANASATCATDRCAIVACSAGYRDCDSNVMTGCEAALNTDVRNCGACGTACVTGQSCVSGACQCPAGQTICLGACTSTQTDRLNCGACNLACPAGQVCVSGACSSMPLYHGWASPIAGCLTTSYNTTATTALGGMYPFNTGDSPACRAWKLAATVCTTQPVMYSDVNNWMCPQSGGFTDPRFGTYCAVSNQYSCSTCPGLCNAGTCSYRPLSLRNCSGSEVAQP